MVRGFARQIRDKGKPLLLVGRRYDNRAKPPERWHGGLFARIRLALQKRIAVARNQRLQNRMIGHVGLQERPPARSFAASATGNLRQHLIGALGGAQIAIAQPQIGVDHTDKTELGEMMSLGDNLRADDNVDPAFGNQLDSLANTDHPADMVRGQNRGSGFWKPRGHFLGDALDPRPASHQFIGGSATVANLRRRARVPAMVTLKLTAEAMFHHPRIAIRAVIAMTTCAAYG